MRKTRNICFSVSLNISTLSFSKKNCESVMPNALQMHCKVSNFGGDFLAYSELSVAIGIPAFCANL